MDLIALLRSTSPITRFVLAVLLIFSVWSWGIILSKSLLLRTIRKESETFWKIFRKGQSLSEIATACETLRFTPLVPVFNVGADLLEPRANRPQGQGRVALKTATTSLPLVQRTLQRAASGELTKIERRMTFLATTASVAPFVGLFGTVWGVMTSFSGLANANVATLRAVAPGIADALIATAFGLFTAIPAVIAYNHFVYEIRNLGGHLDDLQVEMLAIAEGNSL
jgi:biopolymer transport protein TolQ